MLGVGNADEWNLIKLMFDGPHHVVHGGLDDEIHPAISQKRRGRYFGVRGARMLVWIQLLEIESKLFQHRAPIGVIFELFQTLPGDVERCVARHDVSNEALSCLPRSEEHTSE